MSDIEAPGLGGGSDGPLGPLLNLVPDATVVVDSRGVVIAANFRADELFGYSSGELVGEFVEMLVPERLRNVHRRSRAGYLDSPRSRSMGEGLDLFGRRKDASEFPVDISLAPVEVRGQHLIAAAIRDVSVQRAATAAEAQLATLVRSSNDAILGLTLQAELVAWNPGAERMFGMSTEEALGSHISRLVPKDQSKDFEVLLEAAVHGRHPSPLDTQWSTATSARLDVAISVSPVYGPDGVMQGFSVLCRDITERKLYENMLLRQERSQAAMAQIRLEMLSGVPLSSVLTVICQTIVELLGARAAAFVTVRANVAAVMAESGFQIDVPTGCVLSPEPATMEEQLQAVAASLLPAVAATHFIFNVAPADGAKSVAAVITAVPNDRRPFAGDEAAFLEDLAAQSALAVELADARADQERLLLTADRERIARDLHDLVIQRLFGAGMGLQGALRLIDDEHAASRVASAIDDLDATIRQIRSAIFALDEPASGHRSIRADLLEVVRSCSEILGFRPDVGFSGPVDTIVRPEQATQLLAVLREALSNAAKHARAKAMSVELAATDDELVLMVQDDGVGIGAVRKESGLANVRFRASALGGSMAVSSVEPSGTRLEWRIPIT